MYKVMIVDDDYPVLQFLRGSIQWGRLGMEVIGFHDNSMDALSQAETDPPDILLTDIGMPQMNGLQLIERMREYQPNLRAIILSCMDDFELARQAVKLNVQEYILKESFKPGYIEDLLRGIAEQLSKERETSARMDRLKQAATGNRLFRKRAFVKKTINGTYVNQYEWEEEAEAVGVRLTEQPYLPVLCWLNDRGALKNRFGSEELLMSAIENMIGEIIVSVEGAVVTAYNAKFYLLWFPHAHPGIGNLNPRLQIIQSALQKFLSVQASFLYGKPGRTRSEVRSGLSELINSSDIRFYLTEGAIHNGGALPLAEDDLDSLYPEASKQFLELFFEQDERKSEATLLKWMAYIREKRYPATAVKEWILKLVYEMQTKLKSMSRDQTPSAAEAFHRTINEQDTLQEIQDWLSQYLRKIVPLVNTIYLQAKKPEILKAQRYIELHLDSKITLDEVAKELHMNASYFSRLFKKETGETFVEYVTKMKMERGKELLRWTNSSIEAVSESLGYDNKSYFAKLFKSLTGVTPGEFREERNGGSD